MCVCVIGTERITTILQEQEPIMTRMMCCLLIRIMGLNLWTQEVKC